MKKILALAALAALAVSTPALAQRHGGGGGHGGFHGGGHVGGGWHGGGGYRGGFGGYRGYRYGSPSLYFGFGAPAYYPPYYGPMYSPYYYGYPYPPAYRSYSYSEDLGDDDDRADRGERDWRVTRKENETDYELPDSVLFGLDSATISPDADAVLKEIADAAKEQPRARLVIEGHTDTSGTREHNQELSDARARAVAAVLARAGVERERITTEGLGETALAVQTGDEVREPRNRRVVVRLIGASRAQAADAPPADAPRGGNRP